MILALAAVDALVAPAPVLRRSAPARAADGDSAWASRPRVPELAQARSETPAAQRVPWDWRRFLSQSSKFVSLPSLGAAAPARAVGPGDAVDVALFPLDDVVMGGASASTFDNAARRWTGTVTTRNSGGFVGIRSQTLSPAVDASRARGLALRVRGDASRRFKVILRDSTDFNGIAHTASFDVAGPPRWGFGGGGGEETVRVPFAAFVPTIFARTVPDAALDLTNVVAVQFALSKFEYDGALNGNFREGAFALDLLEVGFY